MNTTIPCPLCGGALTHADSGTRARCANCGAYVNVVLADPDSAESVVRAAVDQLMRIPVTSNSEYPQLDAVSQVVADVRLALNKWLTGEKGMEVEIRFDAFYREVSRRSQFGRAWGRENVRPLFDAGRTVDEVLATRPVGR